MQNNTTAEEELIWDFLGENKQWRYENRALILETKQSSFEAAIALINKVSEVSIELDHHPEINNSYTRVTFTLCTHDMGGAVTGLDLELAKKINAILE